MTAPPHQQSAPASGRLSTALKIGIPLAILVITACCCCCAAAYLDRESIIDLIRPVGVGEIELDRPAGDGSVSGAYHLYERQGGGMVLFDVSADGAATFRLESAPESETLTAVLNDRESASMTWNGTSWDGLGPLTEGEETALASLMENDLWHGLEAIPFRAGCRGENAPTPEQVAALLVPLQMGIKYQIADRAAEMEDLKFYALCEVETGGEWTTIPSAVLMSSAAPVPVVLGYFPFDAEGAVEPTSSGAADSRIACLEGVPSTLANPLASLSGSAEPPAADDEIPLDETGPCDAKCRGACGADCHYRSCRETPSHIICERDAMGRYTGYEIRVISYVCGVHEGCIKHDLCYDACNGLLGCGTWAAAVCRHGYIKSLGIDPSAPYMCDEAAIAEYGLVNTGQWVLGQGPQPIERIFDYTDPTFPKAENHGKCPPGSVKEEETEKAEPEEPAVPDEPKAEPEKPEPEPPPVDEPPVEPEPAEVSACDLLPVDGIIRPLDNGCLGNYASELGVRTIQIGDVRRGNTPTEQMCENLKVSDYHTVELELDIGDCGFRYQSGYQGKPAPGYEGWGIMFYYKRFHVRVATSEPYPAHQMWIFDAAEEVEETIFGLNYEYD